MATWTALTWDLGDVCTVVKLDAIFGNDDYIRTKILAHTHDGSDSAMIAAAAQELQGGVFHHVEKKSISAASNDVFYLTTNGASDGTSIFADVPAYRVFRGDTTSFDDRMVGHSAAGTMHFYSVLEWDSGNSLWKVTVYNKDAATAYTFWLIAAGV
jgi:hypothetical protein